MGEIIDAVVSLIISRYGVAVAVPLIISWSGTQFIKKLRHIEGSKVILLAFALAAVPTFLLWPAYNLMAFFAALAVGFSSPTAYKILIAILKKRRPELARALSGGD